MRKIVTLTVNPAIDYFAEVEQVAADEKLRCCGARRDPGGGGINVARAVHRLGGEARAIFPAGGTTGKLLGRLLAEEDLPASTVQIDAPTREDFTAYETGSGRQFRFVLPGGEVPRPARDRIVEEALREDPDYLVASGSLPPRVPEDFYGDLAARCRTAGIRLVLDTSGAALRHGAEAGVFLLKPNLRELGQLAGSDVAEDPEQERAACSLLDGGAAEVVVVSLGAAGVLLVSGEGVCRIHAPTVRIRSKVGAGDSTVGGLVLALARGEELTRAVRFGVAAGAAAVMTPGSELCRREDAERLYDRMSPTDGMEA